MNNNIISDNEIYTLLYDYNSGYSFEIVKTSSSHYVLSYWKNIDSPTIICCTKLECLKIINDIISFKPP